MSTNVSHNKIKNALAWSFAAEIAAKMIVPVTNMILARILTPDAFGIIASINIIVSFADMISTYGVSKYVVQHEFNSKDELYKNADVAFWTNIFVSILGWLFIVIFSTDITNLIGKTGYEKALIIAALSLPLTGFASVQEAFFQRLLDFKALFYRRLIASMMPFFVTIPLALCGWGYWSLILGTLVGNISKILILCFYSPWNPSLFYSFNMFKKMFSFCTWMFMGAVSSWCVYYIDIFLVSRQMGEYYTGLYSNSQTTVTGIISIITASVSSVLFSSLSREQNNDVVFKSEFYKFQKNIGILLLPMGIGMLCFSDLITIILLGDQWMEASRFIGMWSLSTVLFCLFADFSTMVFKAKGKPYLMFYVQIVQLAFLIIVCNYAVERGFLFLGFIRSLANILIIILYLIVLKKIFDFSPLKMILELKIPFLAAILMGFLAVILQSLNSSFYWQFVYVWLCIIVYFAILSCFKEYRAMILAVVYSLMKRMNIIK